MQEKEWVWLGLTQRKTLFVFFFFNAFFGIFLNKKIQITQRRLPIPNLMNFQRISEQPLTPPLPLFRKKKKNANFWREKKYKYTAFTYLNLVKYIPQYVTISAMSFFGSEMISPPPPPWRFSENSSDLVGEAFPYQHRKAVLLESVPTEISIHPTQSIHLQLSSI